MECEIGQTGDHVSITLVMIGKHPVDDACVEKTDGKQSGHDQLTFDAAVLGGKDETCVENKEK